ncbi:MAG: DUF4350 domain-containing protein [Chitinophagaceae bacterium]|nr:MAG: DUF4350 domain-containing protein [Chitinophagaceae bacterium]
MKKSTIYIILAIVGAAVIAMFAFNNRWGVGERKLNTRMSFRKSDRIPYGLNAAYTNLRKMFPDAAVSSSSSMPGNWDSINLYTGGQAVVIISRQFNADDYELKELRRFVESGNDVFISTTGMSNEAQAWFGLNVQEGAMQFAPVEYIPDTLSLSLDKAVFPGPLSFSFPGKKIDSYFTGMEAATSTVLGSDENGRPDFIRMRAGSGHFYVHLAPIAFTNYFLLHKKNMDYYEQVMSLIPANTERIIWDEYFPAKKDTPPEARKNWLSVLMSMRNSEGKQPFKAALLGAILLLLLYTLLGLRRKQRIIPIIRKESNSSLDFTRTIGRLYHDKGDHTNLARKMGAYFLEHVRSRYKLVTSTLDENFARQLHYKTGVNEPLVQEILHTINHIEHNQVSAAQLAAFHKQLETFYKTA